MSGAALNGLLALPDMPLIIRTLYQSCHTHALSGALSCMPGSLPLSGALPDMPLNEPCCDQAGIAATDRACVARVAVRRGIGWVAGAAGHATDRTHAVSVVSYARSVSHIIRTLWKSLQLTEACIASRTGLCRPGTALNGCCVTEAGTIGYEPFEITGCELCCHCADRSVLCTQGSLPLSGALPDMHSDTKSSFICHSLIGSRDWLWAETGCGVTDPDMSRDTDVSRVAGAAAAVRRGIEWLKRDRSRDNRLRALLPLR